MSGLHLDATLVAVVGILAIVVIVLADRIAPKVRMAAPLLLVLLGVGVSFLPFFPDISVNPEIILAGILPPLLYSSAAAMPTMEFRRDFSVVGVLSVLLVLISALALGWLFTFLIPGLPFALGVALGAILSPTDAVATTIIKRIGVSPRIVTILEGESLFNDASSLVVMRSALAATAASISLWHTAGTFVWSVVAALVVGWAVGQLGLVFRRWLGNPVASTALSFIVPFAAYVPAELLEASGLVAVAMAGLVNGHDAVKFLDPRDRFSERANWRTVGMILEGIVFLVMGLELAALVDDVHSEHGSVWTAIGIGAVAALAIVAIRALVFVPLLAVVQSRAKRAEQMQPMLDKMTEVAKQGPDAIAKAGEERLRAAGRHAGSIDHPPDYPGNPGRPSSQPWQGTREQRERLEQIRAGAPEQFRSSAQIRREMRRRQRRLGRSGRKIARTVQYKARRGSRQTWQQRLDGFSRGLQRRLSDVNYFLSMPLGPKEGAVLVWAGMRGVVTLAAAQALPEDVPHRSLLVLVAFVVAAGSLLVQGATLPLLVRVLGLKHEPVDEEAARLELFAAMNAASAAVLADKDLRNAEGNPYPKAIIDRVGDGADLLLQMGSSGSNMDPEERADMDELRLRVLDAQRQALLDAKETGAYSSDALQDVMLILDGFQIGLDGGSGV